MVVSLKNNSKVSHNTAKFVRSRNLNHLTVIEDKEKDFDYIMVHKKIINSKTCVADLCKFISCEECPKFDKKINW